MVTAYLLGGATSPFVRRHDMDLADLAAGTARRAIRDAAIDERTIDVVFAATVHGGEGFGQRIAARIGLAGRPVLNLENACASSSVAVHEAAMWIAAGAADTALVVGAEKLSDRGSQPVSESHSSYDFGEHGVSWPVRYALEAVTDIRAGLYAEVDMARVAVKNRRFAHLNPNAQFRSLVTEADVESARMVATPLTLLMCSAKSDGASALIVSRKANSSNGPAARIVASAMRSGQLLDGVRRPERPVTSEVAHLAYETAGIGPEDVDVVELHDAFACAELEHYVSLGLAKEGAAGELLHAMMRGDGGVTVNPGGGLLSRGHPIGATGAAQIVEVLHQVTNRASGHQVAGARIGMTHTMGGTEFELESNVCMVHIIEAVTA